MKAKPRKKERKKLALKEEPRRHLQAEFRTQKNWLSQSLICQQ